MTNTRVAASRAWAKRHPFLTFVVLAYAFSWSLWSCGRWRRQDPVPPRGTRSAGGRGRRDHDGRWIAARLAPSHLALAGEPAVVGLRPGAYALGPTGAAVRGGNPRSTGFVISRRLVAGTGPAPRVCGDVRLRAVSRGALEEPGWRGFGLPLLQEQYSPVRATLVLGLVWGVWHVPLEGPAGFVVPMVLVFFYTVLWNRTRSVLLCILLHASFTPAQHQLILMARGRAYTAVLDAPDWAILGTYLVAVLILIAVTRGRLGKTRSPVVADVPLPAAA